MAARVTESMGRPAVVAASIQPADGTPDRQATNAEHTCDRRLQRLKARASSPL